MVKALVGMGVACWVLLVGVFVGFRMDWLDGFAVTIGSIVLLSGMMGSWLTLCEEWRRG